MILSDALNFAQLLARRGPRVAAIVYRPKGARDPDPHAAPHERYHALPGYIDHDLPNELIQLGLVTPDGRLWSRTPT